MVTNPSPCVFRLAPGLRQDAGWIQQLARAQDLRAFDDQGLANLLWAFAKAESSPS